MKKIILLGTWHEYQKGTLASDDVAQFRQLLRDLCLKHSPGAIAEEMSQEALTEKAIQNSIPQEIASQLQLKHQYSDPPKSVRKELCILSATSNLHVKKKI